MTLAKEREIINNHRDHHPNVIVGGGGVNSDGLGDSGEEGSSDNGNNTNKEYHQGNTGDHKKVALDFFLDAMIF